MINEVFDKVFLNHQKANLLLLRGNAYAELAVWEYNKEKVKKSQEDAKKKTDSENIRSEVDKDMWDALDESGEEGEGGGGGNGEKGDVPEEDCNLEYNFNPDRSQTDVRSAITSSNLVNDRCLDYVSLLYNENGFKYKNTIPDTLLLIALIQHESNGCNPDADDGLGSYGLMQVQRDTFSEICNSISTNFEDIKGQANVQNNIDCGVKILENKKKFFGFNCDNLQCDHPFSNSASNNGDNKCYTSENPAICGFKYKCTNKNKYYCEWEAVLRAYNGWSCKLSSGDDANTNYVEDIMNIYEDLRGKIE